jgi:hypothetical protein
MYRLIIFICIFWINSGFAQNLYLSQNHFSFEIPKEWDSVPKKQYSEQYQKLGIKNVESIFLEDQSSIYPGLTIVFNKDVDSSYEKYGFKKWVKVIQDDMIIEKANKAVKDILPDLIKRSVPSEPTIDFNKRRILLSAIQEINGFGNIALISVMYMATHGTISLNFTIPIEKIDSYSDLISRTIKSFQIEDKYRLKKD